MDGNSWVVNNEHQAKELCKYIMANVDKKLIYSIKPETRTTQQNRAIWAYCAHIARELDARGKICKRSLRCRSHQRKSW